ncbi:MAG: hypothetical protein ABI640_09550 [Gammaproteobacteria bacterium]
MAARFKGVRCVLLLAGAGVAAAQSSFDVTMRVVDDTRGLNAAVIVIGADAIEIRWEQAPQEGAAGAPVQ